MALRAMGRPFALARRMGGHRMMCSGENPSRSTVVGGKEFLSPASTIPVPALAPLLWRFQVGSCGPAGPANASLTRVGAAFS